MAKTRQEIIETDPHFIWVAYLIHDGPWEPWNPAARHYFGYSTLWLEPTEAWTCTWQNSEREAEICARLFAAVPQIKGCTCLFCRYRYPVWCRGPHAPRYNIIRGENLKLTPVTSYIGHYDRTMPPPYP